MPRHSLLSRLPATARRRVLAALVAALSMLALALALALVPDPASARCVDEDSLAAFSSGAATAPAGSDPRSDLQALVREATARSHSIGASELLASAALQDVEEARAAKGLQASAGLSVGPGGGRTAGVTENSPLQLRASVNVSQLLWDGGRADKLVDWRVQLAESARHGSLNQQEQLALGAVALAIERSRLKSQVQVWGQHLRKTACLVEALETIVRADRGRASELVQARKTMEQAELSQTQTQSLVRQIELRLRRLVGDGLPGLAGLPTLFTQLVPLPTLLAEIERMPDIAMLGAQAEAASRYADASAAAARPQVSWQLGVGAAVGVGRDAAAAQSGNYTLGLSVTVPLLSPGLDPGVRAARKRAEAATLQRAEALEAKRWRMTEVHEQAQATLDRARRLAAVLRSSDQVRGSTLQQWQQLGRRSLFDVMGAEAEHYHLRVAYVNALHDLQQLNANLLSLGRGVLEWLR